MKRIFFTFGLILMVSLGFSQKSKRVSAYNLLKDGILDEAKEYIDKCVEHPKTMKDARAWLYYGQIYHSIATSNDKVYKKLDDKAEEKALKGYEKAILFNFIDESYHNLDIVNKPMDMVKFSKALMNRDTKYVDEKIVLDVYMNRLPALSNAFINKGLNEYQNKKNYSYALELFEKSLQTSSMVGKVDTQAVYLCARAATEAKNNEKAIKYYKALTKVDYGADEAEKAKNYYFLAKLYLENKDSEKYASTLKKGIEKYPNSSFLIKEMINYYLQSGKQKEALAYLDKGIAAAPNSAELYYVKGTIYDTDSVLHDETKAIECYKKAIEIKPDHFDSYYNIGVMYFNKGADKNNEAKNIDFDDQATYKKVKAESDKYFKEALPYLEKAHEINPKDMNTMQSLKLVYYRTGDLDKREKIMKEMKGE